MNVPTVNCQAQSSDNEKMGAKRELKTVVLYPDLLGEGLLPGGFADRLLRTDTKVVALVNGPEPRALAPVPRKDVTVVVSPVSGLAASLRYGYRVAAEMGDVVVRIDTAENPTDHIMNLGALASTHGGAVGDLRFSSETLRAGSADELPQLDVFPTLFRTFTDGRLTLTGMHGFQAWRSDVLLDVLPFAERLWDQAGGFSPLRWAFDAAMALAADTLGMTPVVVHYDAFELRDRERAKISEQFDAVVRVLLSYQRTRG